MLAKQAEAGQVAAASAVLALALILCTFGSNSANQVLPDGRARVPNNLAYIDTSHVEAFSGDLRNDYGISGFARADARRVFAH